VQAGVDRESACVWRPSLTAYAARRGRRIGQPADLVIAADRVARQHHRGRPRPLFEQQQGVERRARAQSRPASWALMAPGSPASAPGTAASHQPRTAARGNQRRAAGQPSPARPGRRTDRAASSPARPKRSTDRGPDSGPRRAPALDGASAIRQRADEASRPARSHAVDTNGALAVNISTMITPSEKMSAAGVAGSPAACSGA
jgi:hypothetical protein